MMPYVPLHSMVESDWIVPRDENLESSLFLLEQQEKEYNESLSEIANIVAPEPIGKQRHSSLSSSHLAGMGMSMTMDSSAHGMMRRVASPSTSRQSRSSRSRTSASGTGATRVSPRRAARGATGRSSTSVSRGGDRGFSYSRNRSGEDGASNLPMPTSPITPPPRTDSGIARMRSYGSSEEMQSNQSTPTHMDD